MSSLRMRTTFTNCVSATYASKVSPTHPQNDSGSGTKPRSGPSGENGRYAPTTMIAADVKISGQLARLCKNGILFVRIT